jgi:hypothetical protein
MRQLFAPEGAHLTNNHMPIGADRNALSLYTHDEICNNPWSQKECAKGQDVNMVSFQINPEHDMHRTVQFIQRAEEMMGLQKRPGAGPAEAAFGWRLSACPFTPPTWMKKPSNYSGGSMRIEYLQAYAHYLSNFITAYSAFRVNISALYVQNEPTSAEICSSQQHRSQGHGNVDKCVTGGPSCMWTGALLQTFISKWLQPRIALTVPWCEISLGILTDIASPTAVSITDAVFNRIASDTTAKGRGKDAKAAGLDAHTAAFIAKESGAAAGSVPVSAVGFTQFSVMALAKLRAVSKGDGGGRGDGKTQQLLVPASQQTREEKLEEAQKQRQKQMEFTQQLGQYVVETGFGDGENHWSAALRLLAKIRRAVASGVRGYTYSAFVLPEGGRPTWGWPQNSLISISRDGNSSATNPDYWAIRHFSQWVKPGASVLRECMGGSSHKIEGRQFSRYTIHSSHTLLSYTPLIHSSHTLLSCTPLIHSSHALLSCTPLIQSSHTLLSCTPLIRSSHALLS